MRSSSPQRILLLELDDGAYFRLIFQMAAKFALPQQGKLILNEKDLSRAPKDFNAQLEAAVKAIPGAALSLSDSTRPIDGGICAGLRWNRRKLFVRRIVLLQPGGFAG